MAPRYFLRIGRALGQLASDQVVPSPEIKPAPFPASGCWHGFSGPSHSHLCFLLPYFLEIPLVFPALSDTHLEKVDGEKLSK